MEFNFKRFFWAIGIIAVALWYISTHFDFMDAVTYAKAHPDPERSPKLEYYAGMAYFLRSDYDHATEAFEQMLADYPTCQYAPRGLLRLGDSYGEKRDYAKSRGAYEKYMEQFPEGKEIKDVKDRYEYIKFR